MKILNLNVLIFLLLMGSLLTSCEQSNSPAVLVFSKTKGWKHTSIPAGMRAVQSLGNQNKFSVDTTRDASVFTDENLKRYDAVVFLNTTGNVLNAEQQAAFERFIQAGGGFAGIHAAADTEYEWPWYDKLVGAHFANHPLHPGIRKATVIIKDTTHLATKGLPLKWEREEEWYSYRSFFSGIHVLAELDEQSFEGGTNGGYHPIAWYHEFDGGRAFYTGGGHDDASYSDPVFLKHILGGIKYAMGSGDLDYSKAHAKPVPEENRFVKKVLVNDLDTPMELAVSEDGRIFFTELYSGNLYLYDTKTSKQSIVHRFDVVNMGGTGLIGVTLDPRFMQNNFIYVYYSPPVEKEPIIFHLSRFTVTPQNTLDLKSEKILLRVPVQKNSGAHHGGSLAFDKDGNLYLSTGDSTTPFPANGYAPLDEREGEEYFSMDAQRGASNTNDLKGKILRIHPEEDGTYTIPEGNLFPKGTEKTLPEIYVMGCRNPYRIAVNPKTSVVYWGEIGPDAGRDSIQGPRGYDEFNQAKKAGNFGWPYFVGNNFAYVRWDFKTNTAGPHFDPDAPVNQSKNNTGLEKLPPATPPIIWYPYAASTEFPELGTGGRSAMAGSFYTFDKDAASKSKFPEYYDGALFVFDWMRNWVMALRFDEKENYIRSEPFMSSNGDFRRPIDLTFGSDGVMYMLEYGSVYGADNEDARLVKIEYNTGNRAPIANAGIPDPVAADWNEKVFITSEQAYPLMKEIEGEAPLKVDFKSAGSKDLDDDDEISVAWSVNGKKLEVTKGNASETFNEPGIYTVRLLVTDKSGSSDSDSVLVKVGNTKPVVTIETIDNKSFYFKNKPFRYKVTVSDKEDGKVDPKDVHVQFDYNPDAGNINKENFVRPKITQTNEEVAPGLLKIQSSDCKACHTVDKKSVGPTYTAISGRYKYDPNAVTKLATKVIAGGGGNWSTDHVMSAHPQLTTDDAKLMVNYILSVTDPQNKKIDLGQQGSVSFNQHKENEWTGTYTINASYADKGANGISPLTDAEIVRLRSALQRPIDADVYKGIERFGKSYTPGKHKSYILFRNIDLTGIRSFIYEYGTNQEGCEIEVRLESFAGPVIANAKVSATGGWDEKQKIISKLSSAISGRHHVYFIIKNAQRPKDEVLKLWTIEFSQN